MPSANLANSLGRAHRRYQMSDKPVQAERVQGLLHEAAASWKVAPSFGH
jgi:hypothetical protein